MGTAGGCIIIFEEDNFTYVIIVFDGETMVKERLVTLEASLSPREEFNLKKVEDYGEMMLTLVQMGDCREEIVTSTIPICKCFNKNVCCVSVSC